MRRSACGYGGYGQPQPDMNMNYHRSHSEHVTKFAGNPRHAGCGGAVQHHTAVHKESFEEVDGDCYDPRRGHSNHALQQQQQAHRHHNGGGSHRYETYQETYEESCEEDTYEESCEEETYSAGRRHGNGHAGVRELQGDLLVCYEDEEEVVGGGGYAQLKRGQRCA
uniref:Uncharacterized protein n=1 Tax=Setaria italica TaxID=4555 RepID=K3XT66_SETIT